MFEYRNKKIVVVCPKCGKDEFKETSHAPMMKNVGKTHLTTPFAEFFECTECGYTIINPSTRIITQDEADLIINAFPYIFDEDVDYSSPDPITITRRHAPETFQQLRKIFQRVLK